MREFVIIMNAGAVRLLSLCMILTLSNLAWGDTNTIETSSAAVKSGAESKGGIFDSWNMTLQSHISMDDFYLHPNLTNLAVIAETEDYMGGNDIWGYTSPSGRKIAIIGLYAGIAFVDITTRTNPVIIEAWERPYSWWRDIRTYGSYAYVVTEEGDGDIYIYDLSDVDNGNVTLANQFAAPSAHNVAIDTDSGYLYQCGGPNGMKIYDLNSNPENPAFVANWNNRYIHDLQVVTYDAAPYIGQEIVFAATPNNSVTIIDVTDKNNIVELSNTTYSPAAYSHQGWLSPDKQYFYHTDEHYGALGTNSIRVFDVSDLSAPFLAATTTNGNTGLGHNIFSKGNYLYQAAYHSGLRIYDVSDPVSPIEAAYFDTYPTDDAPSDFGLWGTYPWFDDGTIIGSDYTGLFIWDFPPAGVEACPDCEDPRLTFVVQGTEVCLTVPSSLSPMPPYAWTKIGGSLPLGRNAGVDCQTLQIFDIQLGDSGTYQCIYTDGSKTPAVHTVYIEVGETVPVFDLARLSILIATLGVAGILTLRRSRILD